MAYNYIGPYSTNWYQQNQPLQISEKVGQKPTPIYQTGQTTNSGQQIITDVRPGFVLGAADGGFSGTNQTPTQAPTQAPTQEPQGPSMQDQVNNAYSGYISSLDQQLGELGGYQNQQNEYIGNQANLSQNLLDTNKTQGLNQLQGYQTEAQSNKAKTLRDIQQDLTNSLQAGQVYLGGMGAGSSSAVGRLSGALAKGANQRTTDVSNQFAKITNDINMQRSNLQSIYDQEVTKLQQWKSEQINNIAQWVQQQRQGLINTKGQVDMQKNMELINMAQQALADIDNQQAQFNQTIQQWAADKATSLDQYMGQIQKMGQYDVPGYTYDPLSGQFQSDARGNVARSFFGNADEEKQY